MYICKWWTLDVLDDIITSVWTREGCSTFPACVPSQTVNNVRIQTFETERRFDFSNSVHVLL